VLDALGTGRLTLRGVTITGGSVVGSDPRVPAVGGGVRAAGDVTLTNAIITGNSVTGAAGGGSLLFDTPINGGAAYGGGVYAAGSLTAEQSTLSMNTVTGGVGGNSPTADGKASGGGAAEGGAAFVAGSITLTGGAIERNEALAGNGGNAVRFHGSGGLARGGGLAQSGSSSQAILLSGTRFTENRAQGGIAGTAANAREQFAGTAAGGALAVTGPLDARDVTVTQNVAAAGREEGGFEQEYPGASGGGFALGGGASIATSTFSSNEAHSAVAAQACISRIYCAGLSDGTARGGAIASEAELKLIGGSYSGNKVKDGHGGALAATAVTITDASFTGNTATGRGGAVAAQTLDGVRLTAADNQAGGTGGGAIATSADVTLRACKISNNGVHSLIKGATGAGIRSAGRVTVEATQITGNRGAARALPSYGGQPSLSFSGGGIHAASIAGSGSTVANNTVTGFSYTSYDHNVSGGGGLAATGSVSLVNSTISGNSVVAPFEPSEPVVHPNTPFGAAVLARTLEIDHVTLADNTNANAVSVVELTAYRSVLTAPGAALLCGLNHLNEPFVVRGSAYDMADDTSCALTGAGDMQSVVAFALGPLADNGGPVETRAPGADSVLIDRIPAASCRVNVDARGVARPQGALCDVGAVEVLLQP
jgi:predicted outer membrane repeat protein